MDKNDDKYYFGVIYWNPDDKRLFVRKRFGVGWTLNFGNPIVIVIFFAMTLGAIIFSMLAK